MGDVTNSQRLGAQKLYNSLLNRGYGESDADSLSEFYLNFPHITYINTDLLAMILQIVAELNLKEEFLVAPEKLKKYYKLSPFPKNDFDLKRLTENSIKYFTAVREWEKLQ